MGILSKLFGRSKEDEAVEEMSSPETCMHANVVPRWDDPNDMGHEDKASAYTCSSCGKEFSPAEGRARMERSVKQAVAEGEQAAARADGPGSDE